MDSEQLTVSLHTHMLQPTVHLLHCLSLLSPHSLYSPLSLSSVPSLHLFSFLYPISSLLSPVSLFYFIFKHSLPHSFFPVKLKYLQYCLVNQLKTDNPATTQCCSAYEHNRAAAGVWLNRQLMERTADCNETLCKRNTSNLLIGFQLSYKRDASSEGACHVFLYYHFEKIHKISSSNPNVVLKQLKK